MESADDGTKKILAESMSKEERKEIIKQSVGLLKKKQIAEMCGVSTRSIDRDIAELKDTGEWLQWIEDRFLDLLADFEVDKNTKFRELARLYGKQFAETHLIKSQNLNVKANVEELLDEYKVLFADSGYKESDDEDEEEDISEDNPRE